MFEAKKIEGKVHRIEYAGLQVRDMAEDGSKTKDSKVALTLSIPLGNGNKEFIEEIEAKYFPGLEEMFQMSEDNARDYAATMKLSLPIQSLIVVKGANEVFNLNEVSLEGRPKVEIKEGEGTMFVKVSFSWTESLDILKDVDESEVVFSLSRTQGTLLELMGAAKSADQNRNVVNAFGRDIEVGALNLIRENVNDEDGRTEQWMIQMVEEFLARKTGAFPGQLDDGHVIRIEEAAEYFEKYSFEGDDDGEDDEEEPEASEAPTYEYEEEIRALLDDNNFDYAEETEIFANITCWKCGEKILDITKDTGDFMCNVCDNEGDFEAFKAHIATLQTSDEPEGEYKPFENLDDKGYPQMAPSASEKPVSIEQVDYRLCVIKAQKALAYIQQDNKLLEFLLGQRAALIAFNLSGKEGKKVHISVEAARAAYYEHKLRFTATEDLVNTPADKHFGWVSGVPLPSKEASLTPEKKKNVDFRLAHITSVEAAVNLLPEGLEEAFDACQRAAVIAFEDGEAGSKLSIKNNCFAKAAQ